MASIAGGNASEDSDLGTQSGNGAFSDEESDGSDGPSGLLLNFDMPGHEFVTSKKRRTSEETTSSRLDLI